jgi:hypothetical protein
VSDFRRYTSSKDRDLKLFGIAYKYEIDGVTYWLDPKRLTVYRLDPKRLTVYRSNNDSQPAVPRKPPWYKRMVKYVLTPSRIVVGIPVAYVVAYVNYDHHVTGDDFWWAYLAWTFASVVCFWLFEAYHWAGGKRLND